MEQGGQHARKEANVTPHYRSCGACQGSDATVMLLP